MARSTLCLLVFLSACSDSGRTSVDGGPSGNLGPLTCMPCQQSSDCAGGACVQYGGDDYCGRSCSNAADCTVAEQCQLLVASDATEVQVCIPKTASCSNAGCTACPAGTSCDSVTGACDAPGGVDGGTTSGGMDGGATAPSCPGYAMPSESACCSSCKSSSSSCQANGCYGGWFCDTSACKCHSPPSNCSTGGGSDGGTHGAPDGGSVPPPLSGSVGPGGGSVSSLYFAVVGDTRPANIDGTSSYPTSIITKIYGDIEALNPRPEFVVTTGDYMFASPSGSEGTKQIALYMQAAQQFTGSIFAAMGNHECTGATASNCASSPTANMNAYLSALVTPLGQSKPYYTVPITDTAGHWTAKIVIAACNDWDSTQYTWLQSELAKPTTYTFVVRHEPTGTSGPPCVSEMDALLASSTYDLFIVGHTHTYAHSGKQVTIGNGGAPISGSVNYGFATINQNASGFTVTQYDYSTNSPVGAFTVP